MRSIRQEDASTTLPSPPPSSSPRPSSNASAFPSLAPTSSSLSPLPSGHAIRRSVTVEDAPQFRRRPISLVSLPSSDNGDSSSPGMRRRSSTMSEFNIPEAGRYLRDGTKNLLDPSAATAEPANGSSWLMSSLPLAFALLPAIAGVFFEGGRDVITDMLLLALVFVFLRKTLSQPWQWYCEAQATRMRQEMDPFQDIEDESEAELATNMTASTGTLDEAPGEHSQHPQEGNAHKAAVVSDHENGGAKIPRAKTPRSRAQKAAVSELYIHEVLALISCFLSPVLGAYLLHVVRGQLSLRPEGLLTDFHITVFVLAAELRPISHTLKLLQDRTVHLQRIVQSTPVEPSLVAKLDEMFNRLAQLEQRTDATAEAASASFAHATQQAQQQAGAVRGNKQDAALVREVRNAIQPELDALNRAVRRYEKKATVLALQTESRLSSVDWRLNDAISLAAAAAKHSNESHGSVSSLLTWATNGFIHVLMMPYHVAMFIIMWPFRTVLSLCFSSSRSTRDRQSRSAKPGRHASLKGTRYGSGSDKDRYKDRMPSRLARRYSP